MEPIVRFEMQHNERMVCEDQNLCFGARYDRQRPLVIRIAAITLACHSATTIVQFRPSKIAAFRRSYDLVTPMGRPQVKTGSKMGSKLGRGEWGLAVGSPG